MWDAALLAHKMEKRMRTANSAIRTATNIWNITYMYRKVFKLYQIVVYSLIQWNVQPFSILYAYGICNSVSRAKKIPTNLFPFTTLFLTHTKHQNQLRCLLGVRTKLLITDFNAIFECN